MSRSRPALLRWSPRSMSCRVSSAVQRSNWLNQLDIGRGVAHVDARVVGEQAPARRALWGAGVRRRPGEHRGPRGPGRRWGEELAVATDGAGGRRAGRRRRCRGEVKGANRLRVVPEPGRSRGAFSGMPGIIGNAWAGRRASAWIWIFSSTHSITAASGGPVKEPGDVVDLPFDEQRVVGQLKSSLRWGCSSKAFQIRLIVDLDSRCARPSIPARRVRGGGGGGFEGGDDDVLDPARRSIDVAGRPWVVESARRSAPGTNRRLLLADRLGVTRSRARLRVRTHRSSAKPARSATETPAPRLRTLNVRANRVSVVPRSTSGSRLRR